MNIIGILGITVFATVVLSVLKLNAQENQLRAGEVILCNTEEQILRISELPRGADGALFDTAVQAVNEEYGSAHAVCGLLPVIFMEQEILGSITTERAQFSIVRIEILALIEGDRKVWLRQPYLQYAITLIDATPA